MDSYAQRSPRQSVRESTARLLNVPESISGRKLERYFTESRKQRKLVSDDDAADALEKYERATLEKEFLRNRIDEIINRGVSELAEFEND